MTRNEKSEIFVVVKAHSGFPVVAEAFLDECAANKYAEKLKAEINPEYDEVEIFQTILR